MKSAPKMLTKSKFKIGHECPNKLYFLDNSLYLSNKAENEFLLALAEGGFQVGELAKIYHPEGIAIDTLDKDLALSETEALLKKDKVTIFEAAIGYGPFFIRVDMLQKSGNTLILSEVKSSTFDSNQIKESGFFIKSKKSVRSEWKEYLLDVAFQAYVIEKTFPGFNRTSNLVLLDKAVLATADGLNQKFVILPERHGDKRVKVSVGTTEESVGAKLLKSICVDEEVKHLWAQLYNGTMSFSDYIGWLAEIYQTKKFPVAPVSNSCKSCEYRIGNEKKVKPNLSGFDHCFKVIEKIEDKDLNRAFVFDIGNFWRKVPGLLGFKRYFAADLTEGDVGPIPRDDGRGWSQSERQFLQVMALQKSDQNVWVLDDQLRNEISSWTYPYHFIDFETARVAIPFNVGRHSYEQIAFQFSHHLVTEDGTITHQTQYLNTEKGKFPNFDFVRALKTALSKDNGAIFRYHVHENTVLNEIREQLISYSGDIPDRKELVDFIESITHRTVGKVITAGKRDMVDLCQVVERFYFHKDMGGRTSIKKVFPAILADSKYLQDKYSKSNIDLGITSLSRGEFVLIQRSEKGDILDPYKDLPPVFDDIDVPDEIAVSGELREGGSAMTAYARMQFSELTVEQKKKIAEALLRYCELDTLAMVLIWDYWVHDLLKRPTLKIA